MANFTRTPESFEQMVIHSQVAPAWLATVGPCRDVVASTRCRLARNVARYPFPPALKPDEAREVSAKIAHAIHYAELPWQVSSPLSPPERDFLAHLRLVSPEFEGSKPGQALWLDEARAVSVLVLEEDHLRIQSVLPGWCPEEAERHSRTVERTLGATLDYAQTKELGHLTTSITNAGTGCRISGMFHLIGLAHTGRLASVLRAIAEQGVVVRGPFGEHSRAIGHAFQVSRIGLYDSAFAGAAAYLMTEEHAARASVQRTPLRNLVGQAIEFAVKSRELSYADALRVLAWVRWGACEGLLTGDLGPHDIDAWLIELDVWSPPNTQRIGVRRAAWVRTKLEYALA